MINLELEEVEYFSEQSEDLQKHLNKVLKAIKGLNFTITPSDGAFLVKDANGRKLDKNKLCEKVRNRFLDDWDEDLVNYKNVTSSLLDNIWESDDDDDEDSRLSEERIMLGIPKDVVSEIKSYIGWTQFDGVSRLVVRKDATNNSWMVAEDPLAVLMGVDYPNSKFSAGQIITTFLDDYRKNAKNSWGVSKPKKKDGPVTFYSATHPTFSDQFKKDIFGEGDLYIPELVEFTNDPKVPALTCFPLTAVSGVEAREKYITAEDVLKYNWNGLKDKFRHWLYFEEQFDAHSRRAWRYQLASIFDASSTSRVAPWIRDKGQTGKSKLLKAIYRLMGKFFMATLDTKTLNSEFWAASAHGRRLILFSDTSNVHLYNTSAMKNLTGGDAIPVNQKNEKVFNWYPQVKVLITSNFLPKVNLSERHQKSRVMLFNLSPSTNPDALAEFTVWDDEKNDYMRDSNGRPLIKDVPYDDWLVEEFDEYLRFIWGDYLYMKEKGIGDIPTPEMEEELSKFCKSENQLAMETLYGDFIEYTKDPSDVISSEEFEAIMKYLVDEISKDKDLLKYIKDDFTDKEITNVRRYYKGKQRRCYERVKLREGFKILNGEVFYDSEIDTQLSNTTTQIDKEID